MTTANRQRIWGRQRPISARSGFTLIEIMVVLVVLIFGIFAIVRLFPGGFLTIRRSAEMTASNALAAEMLSGQQNQLTVAESIVSAGFDNSGSVTIDDTVQPNVLHQFGAGDPSLTNYADNSNAATAYAGTNHPYNFISDVNQIKYVIGETFRIPIQNPSAGFGLGGVYMLQNGPVYNTLSTDTSGNPTDRIAVYGMPLERIEQTASVALGADPAHAIYDDNAVLQNENQYFIDYANGLIGFYPRAATTPSRARPYRSFVISYDYYEVATSSSSNVPVLHSVLSSDPKAVFTVPDDTSGLAASAPGVIYWAPISQLQNAAWTNSLPAPSSFILGHKFLGIRRGSEQVSRKFTLVSSTPVTGASSSLFSDDPYEYAWLSPQIGSIANAGALVFNPGAYGATVQTSTGPRPLTARATYMIYDNHILREELSVPSQAPYTFRLAVPFVLTSGTALADQSIYNGIFDLAGTQTQDLLIYNANTGQELAEIPGGASQGTISVSGSATDTVTAKLDARAGLVTLSATQVADIQNVPIKVFYRGEREWGMQLQKANSHYVPAATLGGLDYHSYFVQGSKAYFPISDEGKTVVVGDYRLTGDGNTPHTNEAFQISTKREPVTDSTGASLTLPYITFAGPLDPTQTGLAVTNVMGVSLKARIVLRDADRWRMLDTDTLLTPAAAQ